MYLVYKLSLYDNCSMNIHQQNESIADLKLLLVTSVYLSALGALCDYALYKSTFTFTYDCIQTLYFNS